MIADFSQIDFLERMGYKKFDKKIDKKFDKSPLF